MLGVWVNFAAVVVGGLIGCLLKGGIKEKYRQTINLSLIHIFWKFAARAIFWVRSKAASWPAWVMICMSR